MKSRTKFNLAIVSFFGPPAIVLLTPRILFSCENSQNSSLAIRKRGLQL